MRLLSRHDDGHFSLHEFMPGDIPDYAILSHTWNPSYEEVSFKDFVEGRMKDKAGYRKLVFCADQAATDGLSYFWVDTCCIDRSSSAELSEAINSMFAWYRNAVVCYVYLSDVSTNAELQRSRWFTRGWTLQELIAPLSVKFFSVEGQYLGDKSSLVQEIHAITGVPVSALQGAPLSRFSVHERMAWAKFRRTSRIEDQAYCLLGVFGVHMPLIYGEGENALVRLRKETQSLDSDTTYPGRTSDGNSTTGAKAYAVIPQYIHDTSTDTMMSTTLDSDSDYESEIGSIFSGGESSISSASTANLNPVQTVGIREVSRALLSEEELKAIYTLTISSVERKKARSHIRGFLRDYGRDLLKEASNSSLAIQAAKFVRELAGRITDEIIWSITGSTELPHSPKSKVKKQDLETWLSTIQGNGIAEEPSQSSLKADDDESSEDESDGELNDDLPFPNIDKVKGFLINSEAFRGHVLAMQTWLKVDGVDRKAADKSATDTPKQIDGGKMTKEIPRDLLTPTESHQQTDSGDNATAAIGTHQQQDAAQEQVRRTRSRQRGDSLRDLVFSVLNFWGISFYFYDIVELFIPHVPQGYRRLRWRCVSSRGLLSGLVALANHPSHVTLYSGVTSLSKIPLPLIN